MDFEKRVAELEQEKQQLLEYIEFIKEDIEELKESKARLKKLLKADKIRYKGFIRQGLKLKEGKDRQLYGWHYVVFPIEGIPGTLDILDVKGIVTEALYSYLDEEFKDYILESIDYSERRKAWLVQVGNVIMFN